MRRSGLGGGGGRRWLRSATPEPGPLFSCSSGPRRGSRGGKGTWPAERGGPAWSPLARGDTGEIEFVWDDCVS